MGNETVTDSDWAGVMDDVNPWLGMNEEDDGPETNQMDQVDGSYDCTDKSTGYNFP